MLSKRFLSSLLAITMLFSLCLPASAANINDTGSKDVTITYGMSEGFLVTIPTNFTIDESAKATANVSASNVMIAHGAVLEVAISGNDYVNSWELIDSEEATNTLTYTIGSSEGAADIVNNSVVLSVEAGEAYDSTVSETLHFTVIDDLSKSGTYTDTLTFVVSVNGGVYSTETTSISGKYIYVNDVAPQTHELEIQLSSDTITDFSSVSVTRTGKNLFDATKLVIDKNVNNFNVIDANNNAIRFTKTSAANAVSYVSCDMYLPAGTYYFTAVVESSNGNNSAGWYVALPGQTGTNNVDSGAFGNTSGWSKGDPSELTISESGLYTVSVGARYADAKSTTYTVSNIQLEYGHASEFEPFTSQTVTANADGTVSGISSISPSMTIFTDKDVTINCEYQKKITNTPSTPSPSLPEPTTALNKTVANVKGGDIISLESNAIKKNKTLTFDANITSFGSVELRHGKDIIGSSKMVIDSTTIKCYNYITSSTSTCSVNHGLTISGQTNIVATVDKNQKLSVSITSNGKTFTKSGISWIGANGNIELESINTTMENLTLTWDCSDYSDEIWFFGDSYFDGSSARWTYYIAQNYDNFLLCGFPGAGSGSMYNHFQTALTHGTPKYAIWCLGMNDRDSNDSVNSSWQTNVEKFITDCEAKEIIPILATVPNVPERVNYYKNEYVRNSGYRYIDFASAVGANEIGSGWSDGMLSSDGVHPSAAGAQALANQVLIDLPEIK